MELREKEHDVANAELTEIRTSDGAQKYKLDRMVNGSDLAWITGWTRASNVQVGDKGKIVYRSAPTWGLHFFIKGKFMQEVS